VRIRIVVQVAVIGLLLAIAGAGGTVAWAQSAAQTATAVSTGQIQGKVVAAVGATAVSSVTVAAHRISPAPVVISQSVTAAADGTFTISALPTGTYKICVTDKSGTFTNPCEWVDAITPVAVTNGKTTSSVSVSLRRGSTLQVRVNDVASVLAPMANEALPPQVLVRVLDSGGASHAVLEARDAAGVTYSVFVPFDTVLRLQVQSKLVALQTTGQTPVPAQGLTQTFQFSSSKSAAQQPTFAFNATGRN
jgi:hypothetical protein